MDFLPIFVATKGRKVVIVGDGQMADAKCRGVLKTAGRYHCICQHPE